MERGDRGHWWILYFINLVIQARLQLSPLIFQELHESNITCSGLDPWGLPTAKSFAFEDSKHKGRPHGVKALCDQLIAFSYEALLSKTKFRREAIKGNWICSKKHNQTLACLIFPGGCKIFAFVENNLRTQNSVILQCAIEKNVTVLLYPNLWGRHIRHNFGILIEKKIESLTV